ncbi:MAG: hypothetical protein OXU69_01705 [Gemmatimonadota bacterium]|nr:hypothetical protein [Gemmatimonadota bacterium]MDE2983392.1 hypothetical protein [Gemmatimonadota bacterium]
MFDLEKAVLGWREGQERQASLAPCELDELEDHLRARFDLELELDTALAPATAFAIARRELGETATLSREFAKAGRPRWRRWLFAGWGMYAASWFLPVHEVFVSTYGYELLRELTGDLPDAVMFLVMNLAMVMTVPVLRRGRPSRRRWLGRWVGAVGVGAVGLAVVAMVWGSIETGGVGWLFPPPFLVGFWTWTASFLCVARALRLRAKEWRSANAGEALAS